MGHTDLGICDLAGNVYEWLEDEWHPDYNGAPVDGSAWVGDGMDGENRAARILRGGGWSNSGPELKAKTRQAMGMGSYYSNFGFRLACDP